MKKEFFYQAIIEQQNLVAYACDLETYEVYFMTPAAREMCGVAANDDLRGQKCYRVLQGLEAPCSFCTNDKLAPGKPYCWEHFNKKMQRWVALEDTLIAYEGRPCRLEIAQDITEQKEAYNHVSKRLTAEETLVECIQTLSGEGNVTAAMNRFLEMIGSYYVADRAYIFEYDYGRRVLDNTFEWCARDIEPQIGRLQGIPLEYVDDWNEKMQYGEFHINSLENELTVDSPEYRILKSQNIENLSAAPLKKNDRIIGFLGVDNPTENNEDLSLLRNVCSFVLDEMERRRLVQELEHISYTDMLTGLKNRNCYIKSLNHFSGHEPKSLGVIFVDINGMKKINDTFGHEYGDGVIRKASRILRRYVPEGSYRVGGDEFVVLYPDVCREEFDALAENLRRDFAAEDACDVSIGCSWKAGRVCANEQVLRADDLMYAAKQKYYRSVLRQGREVRVGMATEVLKEIEDDRFEVYYQPQVELKTGQIIGAEALVRKRDQDGTLLGPDRFIHYYEEAGVISHVDLHVLEVVCTNLQVWQKQGINIKVAVNFSRVTLMAPGIVEQVKKCCGQHGVAPQSITIEMTESVSTMDYQQLVQVVHGFAEAGFAVSLDDFGSQYSELSMLTELDFNEIKFDKSLVNQLEGNSKNRIVTKCAMDICTALPATRSLAEGIENAEQLALLRQYRCERGQGYFFSKPMPGDELYRLLQTKKE